LEKLIFATRTWSRSLTAAAAGPGFFVIARKLN
jgi:hypothetical protein